MPSSGKDGGRGAAVANPVGADHPSFDEFDGPLSPMAPEDDVTFAMSSAAAPPIDGDAPDGSDSADRGDAIWNRALKNSAIAGRDRSDPDSDEINYAEWRRVAMFFGKFTAAAFVAGIAGTFTHVSFPGACALLCKCVLRCLQ